MSDRIGLIPFARRSLMVVDVPLKVRN